MPRTITGGRANHLRELRRRLHASEVRYADLVAETARQAEVQARLARAREALGRAEGFAAILTRLVETAVAVFGYSQASLYLADDAQLSLAQRAGTAQTAWDEHLAVSPIATVAHTGSPNATCPTIPSPKNVEMR